MPQAAREVGVLQGIATLTASGRVQPGQADALALLTRGRALTELRNVTGSRQSGRHAQKGAP